jgi:putative PIN family toxin of toxin-antitoxin system
MSEDLPRVVLDTVVFVQALISGRGPAATCLEKLRAIRFVLLMSADTWAELKEVPLRPKLTAKYPYVTPDKVAALVAGVQSLSVGIPHPPTVFSLPRDPKDEPFIDLAVAGNARFIVTCE